MGNKTTLQAADLVYATFMLAMNGPASVNDLTRDFLTVGTVRDTHQTVKPESHDFD